jgi:hypothetical protein
MLRRLFGEAASVMVHVVGDPAVELAKQAVVGAAAAVHASKFINMS